MALVSPDPDALEPLRAALTAARKAQDKNRTLVLSTILANVKNREIELKRPVTPDDVVDRMLTMAQVKPNDIHFDLGAGDGKIAIAAAKKFGANATGIEYNPDMARYANERAKEAGVYGAGAGKATIRQADIFATDFSQATVITLYLLPSLNMKLRPQLLSMRPGTRSLTPRRRARHSGSA